MPTKSQAYYLHRTFEQKIANFPETMFKFRPGDHLTAFMRTVLEDPGVGQLLKIQTIARLAESIAGTHYSELDYFFGSLLHFPRLPEETYAYDPFTDQLTADQWREVDRADASYRERLSLMLQAINKGGTQQGIALAAQAACGFPCAVLESWRYNEDLGLGAFAGRVPNSSKEVLIVPNTGGETLDNARRRAIFMATVRIKPADVVISVDENGLAVRTIVSLRHVASPSEYYEVRRYVTGIDLPSKPVADRYFWVVDGIEQEAPTFAHLQSMEGSWQQNNTISTVETAIVYPDTSTGELMPVVDPLEPLWGPQNLIDLADSPDNFPDGKFPGDPAKHDAQGDYIFPWVSQAEYEAWFILQIEALGGQVSNGYWRLPIDVELLTTVSTNPEDSLAPIRVSVQSTYYPL